MPVDELTVEQPSGHAVHHVGKLRPVRLVGDAAALAERPGHRTEMPAQFGPDTRQRREVQRPRAGQTHRVLHRQQVALRPRLEHHDPGRHQRTQALPDVALLQACPLRQARAGVRSGRQHFEQPGPIGQVDHQRNQALGVDPQ